MDPTTTLRSTHEAFLAFLKKKKRAHATLLAYGTDIEQLIAYLEKEGCVNPADITGQHLTTYMQKLADEGYTAKSVSRKTNSTKTYFRFLRQEGIATDDPAQELIHPKVESKPPRMLTEIEYRALRDACRGDIRIGTIVEVLLQTGVRIGELVNIQVDDIHFGQGNGQVGNLVIRPMEGHLGRTVPLNRASEEALHAYLAIRPKTKEKALFITKTGRPLLVRNIRTAIDRCFEIAGISGAKVNDLRHTWIAYHLKAGVSLAVLRQLAGHKRITTTERYLEYVQAQTTESKVRLGEL
ncbi:MAG: tyrosine-type recombinase/integrase [bacterium]|nr:tyrosine-type recombinase/integrase [bacterium]